VSPTKDQKQAFKIIEPTKIPSPTKAKQANAAPTSPTKAFKQDVSTPTSGRKQQSSQPVAKK
jgi:hypothetical protein